MPLIIALAVFIVGMSAAIAAFGDDDDMHGAGRADPHDATLKAEVDWMDRAIDEANKEMEHVERPLTPATTGDTR